MVNAVDTAVVGAVESITDLPSMLIDHIDSILPPEAEAKSTRKKRAIIPVVPFSIFPLINDPNFNLNPTNLIKDVIKSAQKISDTVSNWFSTPLSSLVSPRQKRSAQFVEPSRRQKRFSEFVQDPASKVLFMIAEFFRGIRRIFGGQ